MLSVNVVVTEIFQKLSLIIAENIERSRNTVLLTSTQATI